MESSALASSAAALRSSIKALEICARSLEFWLYAFVSLVAIGVVLEVFVILWDHHDDVEEYRRGTIRSPQKPNFRKLGLELIGAILVAIGVSGEFVVDIKSGAIQTSLRKANEELIQLLEGASSAALTIASQNEKEAAQLEKDAEGLKKAAEDERLARVELEERVAWRSFSERQQRVIKVGLDRFAGQLAECDFLGGDTEAFSFSSEIATALRTAGWQVIPPNPYVLDMKETSLPNASSPIERIDFGVEVTSTSDAPATAAANAIVKKLCKSGFDARFKPSTQRSQPSRVWIMVQHRPLGPQGEAKLRQQQEASSKQQKNK
jgi:hypothetical protein